MISDSDEIECTAHQVEEHQNKKQRFEGDAGEIACVKANDFITLIFVDCSSKLTYDNIDTIDTSQYHHFKPTFTHQIFEEEKITLLSQSTCHDFCEGQKLNVLGSGVEHTGPGLLLYIRCDDLTHYVTTRSIMSPADRTNLMEKILPALPENSRFQKDDGLDSSLPAELQLQCKVSGPIPPGKLLPDTDKSTHKNTDKSTDRNTDENTDKNTDNISHHQQGALISTVPSDKFSTPSPTNSSTSFSSSSFEIYLASDKDSGAGELLRRAEKIAVWHIETADSVDFSDERWEVLNIYNAIMHRKHQNLNYNVLNGTDEYVTRSFAGYMTLFTFNNPFLGSKIRICQALVLPHMQGQGLGRKLLLAAYNLAKSRSSIVEVTVEDPAPAFERLRDTVDCEWVIQHLYREHLIRIALKREEEEKRKKGENVENIEDNCITEDGDLSQKFTVIKLKYLIEESAVCTTDEEKERCKILKLTPAQTFFAYECLQYCVMLIMNNMWISNGDKDTNIPTAQFKVFRLKVKRRILNANKHLKGPNMQKDLEEIWEEYRTRYHRCVEPIKRNKIFLD